MTVEELKTLFNDALIARDPVPKLVKCIYEGLETDKIMAGETIPDGAVRLNFAKFLAECLHIIEPTKVNIDPGSSNDEIIERLQRLLSGADTENPSEAESVGTASA